MRYVLTLIALCLTTCQPVYAGPEIFMMAVAKGGSASTTPLLDNFNRTNGDVGSTNWLSIAALGSTSSSRPTIINGPSTGVATNGNAVWNASASSGNQVAQVDNIVLPQAGSSVGVVVRYNNTTDSGYNAQIYIDGDYGYIYIALHTFTGGNGVSPLGHNYAGSGASGHCNGGGNTGYDGNDTTACSDDDGSWVIDSIDTTNITAIRLNAVGSALSLDTYDGSTWTIGALTATDSTYSTGRIGISMGYDATCDNFAGNP